MKARGETERLEARLTIVGPANGETTARGFAVTPGVREVVTLDGVGAARGQEPQDQADCYSPKEPRNGETIAALDLRAHGQSVARASRSANHSQPGTTEALRTQRPPERVDHAVRQASISAAVGSGSQPVPVQQKLPPIRSAQPTEVPSVE
jgi:hypothetical protein